MIMKLFLFISLYVYEIIAKLPHADKQRVLLIGIDGLLQKCLSQTNHTSIEYIMQEGSYTFKARTTIEAVSAPGWSNILCGQDSETTGITNNDWNAPWFYGKPNDIVPSTGNDSPIPCIFEHIKKNKPEKKVVSFYSWEWFINIGNLTIPNSMDREYFCMMSDMNTSIACDIKALRKAKEVIEEDFDFFFWYLGSLDETGHETRFCSASYIQRMTDLNTIIEEVFDYMRLKGIFDSTTIILTTDHGASYMTFQHGDPNSDNLIIPWLIMGPGIKKNYEIQAQIRNYDTTPTISRLFGLEPNPLWRSKAVDEIFIERKKESGTNFRKE